MKVEIRSDNTAIIEGYVNAVERLSRPLRDFSGEQFREMVKAGTFAKAIAANPHVELYFNHMKPVGGMDTGTLELKEDNIGLYARAIVNDPDIVQEGRDGMLSGWSFAFSVNPNGETWRDDEQNGRVRELNDISLGEVSILDVTPAYYATSINTRDEKAALKEIRVEDDKIESVNDIYGALERKRKQIEILKMGKK
ncbi:MAG: HK97 family phage prohead protease [Dialister invisus]|uniref:HK97 family phage prohead protease n=1 Tax=Dialister invisus TaxID=218538 RepID=UPI002676283F|nr:HK97 family phage prohead protease [Dialister invisus]